jgi:hypothetical protein
MAAERRDNLHPLAGFRMGECYRARVQVELVCQTGNECRFAAIFAVADDRRAERRAMDA